MPPPRLPATLPVIPYVPLSVRLLAEYVLRVSPSPDHVILFADGCDDIAERAHDLGRGATACRTLAAELRRLAPGFA